jgi:hypothetical protein
MSTAALATSVALLADRSKPLEQRSKMFTQVLIASAAHPEQMELLVREFLQQNEAAGDAAKVAALRQEYEAALNELKNGPPRPATYIGPADCEMPGPGPRAHVVTPEGQDRYPFLQDGVSLVDLEPGMTAFLDHGGATVLGSSRQFNRIGQEAVFVRALPDGCSVEVTHQESKYVVYAAQGLLDDIAAERIKRGDRVLWNPKQQIAFMTIPGDSDRTHRFIDDSRIPHIDIEREIGNPHPILHRLIRRTKILLTRPDLLKRFDMRPRYSVFFTGPSGTGKTLTIKAYLSAYAEMLREHTGRDDLGTRVIRVKASTLLSMWFGESDRMIDELFDDIYHLASQEFAINGRDQRLPVVVIFEEAEGLIRKRSGGDGRAAGADGDVYSRVIGTFLQRADDPNDDLSRFPLIWISSTNLSTAVDSAAWRRLCNERAHFKRLDRDGCRAVLAKKLRDEHPYTRCNGTPPSELRQQAIQGVLSWFYSPNGDDQGQVEITFRDGKRQTRYRRDFLTGSIIEQAVALAVNAAAEECERTGDDELGLDADRLIAAFASVIDAIADNVTEYNVQDYLDVPEQVAIAHVRRVRSVPRRSARMAIG